MAEKYEMAILSDLDSKTVLTNSIDILYKYGWRYNVFSIGKYSYWINGPIWEFGESTERIESSIQDRESGEISKILKEISGHFSPLIHLAKVIDRSVAKAIVFINESSIDLSWKQLTIAFDSYSKAKNESIHNELIRIFMLLCKQNRPLCGMASWEMMGMVEAPDLLRVDEEKLGDMNYFDYRMIDEKTKKNLKDKFKVKEYDDIGFFVFV